MTNKFESSAISLFSGAGGLDIAAHEAGFRTIAAIESVPRYAKTLSDNKLLSEIEQTAQFDAWFDVESRSMGKLSPKTLDLVKKRVAPSVGKVNAMSACSVLPADIREVDTVDLRTSLGLNVGELGLIIGGPPCQSFSMSGQRKSIEDVRGQLFLQFARFVEDFRPRWFVFENVKGMTHSAALKITAECPKCGPFTPRHEQVLLDPKASHYPCYMCGANSEVVIRKSDRRGAVNVIVNEFESLGYTCHFDVLNAVDFGVPQFRDRIFIVGSRDNEPFSMPKPTHESTNNQSVQPNLWDDDMRLPAVTVWDTLFSKTNPYHASDISPNHSRLWVKNVVRPHAEPVDWDLRRPSPTIGSHQGAKLAIAPYGVPDEQVFRQQWHTQGRRMSDTPPVDVEHTYLSDSDLLKLQSFPSSWHIAGTRMERAFQIGNAVPPALGRAVFAQIGTEPLGIPKTNERILW